MYPIAACASHLADIVFALPNDADTTRTNHGLAFVRAIASGMNIGEDKVHVGLLPKDCYSVPGFQLKEGHNEQTLDRLLDADHFSTADTMTQLKRMRDSSFSLENGGRDGAARIGVIVIDKNSIDLSEAQLEAQYAKDMEGIELFVVGVGDSVSDSELNAIASEPTEKHVFRVDEYCDLLSVADHLTKRIDQVCASKYSLH